MKSTFVAILATIFTAFFITFVVTYVDTPNSEYYDFRVALLMSSVAAFVSLIITLCWALPIHLYLKKHNKVSLGWYTLIAIIPSLGIIYILKPFGDDSAADLFIQALFCSLVGVVAATVFWYFAVYQITHNKQINKD
jgi:hypothetical protein